MIETIWDIDELSEAAPEHILDDEDAFDEYLDESFAEMLDNVDISNESVLLMRSSSGKYIAAASINEIFSSTMFSSSADYSAARIWREDGVSYIELLENNYEGIYELRKSELDKEDLIAEYGYYSEADEEDDYYDPFEDGYGFIVDNSRGTLRDIFENDAVSV